MNNIQDSKIYDLETNKIGSFPKSLSSVLKGKKTTSLPKKRKKRRLIAKAWHYFKIEGNFTVCQAEKKEQVTLEQVLDNDVEIVRFNLLSALDIDEEISSEEENEDREIDESTIKVLCNITDISSVLPLKKGKKNKRDGQKLSQLLLKDYNKYPTFSLMYSIIRELQNKFIDMSLELSNNDEDSDNEDDLENDDDTHSQASSPPPDLDQIEKQFKIAIYDSLNKYWYNFRVVGLVATLLDPWTKRMSAFTNREQKKAETKLRNEFENLQCINNTSNDQLVQQTSSTVTEIMQNLFFEGIFGVQDQEDIPLNKVARYLKITPINNYNVNP
ncbi:16365_t:CDS:2 [Racocetra fulgida]|uniref:16365_t:CDS:1 n=1 Tax=Racocetra fulgida TaxID=60492 RepID=A0A9N8VDP7_9GLOM|nr:16365_t:CDS:2 [Racocetra fulgida]